MDARRTTGGPSLQVVQGKDRDEERKLVTVVFADLSGSTALAERLDPEDLRQVLSSFLSGVTRTVEHLGGTVDKYIGDAVMAVFGAPTAHEDDAPRALQAALDMLDMLRGFNRELEQRHRTRLHLRIGVNTGEVVAGPIAPQSQSTYTVVGDTVNTAQRLQTIADLDNVMVGAMTRRLADKRFTFEQVAPVRVKGKAEPVAAYRLVGPRSRDSRSMDLRSALVGRDRELSLLLDAVGAVERGEGRVALIIGEAGSGKSRLLAEAARASAGRALRGLEGRSLATARDISYRPFIEILRRDAGIVDEQADARTLERLRARATDLLVEEADAALPYLATLIGLPLPADLAGRLTYVDPQAMAQQIFAIARRYVSRLAAERPIVLMFEDWHWADESSATLLEHLLPLVDTQALGICITSRLEQEGEALTRLRALVRERGERSVEIRLGPLDGAACRELVQNLLATESVAPALSHVLDRAQGNPFFIEETVRALVDLGTIVRDSARAQWRVGATDPITIPETVHGLIAARIDSLDEDHKRVLKAAAVIGRTFPYRLLRLLAKNADVDAALQALQERDLIRERTPQPEAEYVFKHALVEEVAYESILVARRRELHAAIGDAIEQMFSERVEEFYGQLAYHFARAENWAKAQAYLFKAGDLAGRIGGDVEALANYGRALAAYERAFGDRWDPIQRSVVERRMGEALFRRGDHIESYEYLTRSLELLGFGMPASRRAIRVGIVRELVWQIAHRYARVLFVGRRHDPAPKEWLRTFEVMGYIDFFTDPERLVYIAIRMLNLSEANAYALGTSMGSMAFGLVCDAFALSTAAGHYHRRALRIAQEIDHPLAIGLAYAGLGYHEQHTLGKAALAAEHYRLSAEVYRSAGDLRLWSTQVAALAQVRIFQADFENALALARDIVRAGDDGADDQMKASGRREIGSVLLRTGDLEEAAAHLIAANDLSRTVPDYQTLVIGLGELSECRLSQGHIDEGIDLAREAVRLVRAQRIRTFYASAGRNALVHAYLLAAERADRKTWLPLARAAATAALAQTKLDRESLPPAFRLRGHLAWIEGSRRTAQIWWDRSSAAARTYGAPHELRLTELERARLMDE